MKRETPTRLPSRSRGKRSCRCVHVHTQTHSYSWEAKEWPRPFSTSAALLGLHSGHVDKPGQHDAGSHPLHASDVCGHRPRCHGDGRQRAGGLPAAEGQRAPADGLSRCLQTPQIQLNKVWNLTCALLKKCRKSLSALRKIIKLKHPSASQVSNLWTTTM